MKRNKTKACDWCWRLLYELNIESALLEHFFQIWPTIRLRWKFGRNQIWKNGRILAEARLRYSPSLVLGKLGVWRLNIYLLWAAQHLLYAKCLGVYHWHLHNLCFIVMDANFLPARRYASAGNSDRNVSVRLSVHLSRTGIVSKRRKLASWFLHHLVAPKSLVFWRQISSPNSKGFPPNVGLKQGVVGRKNSAIF